MAIDFAEKLQLTARALGCVTQKELCARFFALNPTTHFTLQNSYKWMKGRSQPRSGEVYRDWARLLDLDRSPQFLADCPLDIFAGLLSARYAHDLGTPEPSAISGAPKGPALLRGTFACYSPAWSKAARDRLIRGSLTLSLEADGTLNARYEEDGIGAAMAYSGRAHQTPRSFSVMLDDAENEHTLFFSLSAPLPPCTVLTGLIAGAAFHDLEARPTAARILGVRSAQPLEKILAGNRYLDASAEEINRDLASLGYDLGADPAIGEACRDFLMQPSTDDRLEISLAESEAMAVAFARLRLP